MAKYKTKNGQDYILPNVGRTVNGEIETDAKIENPNFILVTEGDKPAPAAQAAAAPAAAPAAPTAPPSPAPVPPAPAKPVEGAK